MRFVGIIPARYHSSRLPAKALIRIAGRSLIEWVYRRVCQAPQLDGVWVATDDVRISQEVRRFGGEAILTRPDHLSGTDRVAEAARQIEADVYVNVQGDEPLISLSAIEGVCAPFRDDPQALVATAKVRIDDPEEIESPNAVKVVTDLQGRALYFSRCSIPNRRGRPAPVCKHLGIYAYRRSFLQGLHLLKPSPLERSECLEQLRFLENSVPVYVAEVTEDSPGIDTLADLERVRPVLENAARLQAVRLKI